MNAEKYIFKHWGVKSIDDYAEVLKLDIGALLLVAFNLNLHKKNTPNISRRWTAEEEDFLVNHASQLSIREASNLMYRSYYAMYQRIRVLGLGDIMIKKRKG